MRPGVQPGRCYIWNAGWVTSVQMRQSGTDGARPRRRRAKPRAKVALPMNGPALSQNPPRICQRARQAPVSQVFYTLQKVSATDATVTWTECIAR
jgi:hypothetical protein